jgi:predicted helicase
MTQLIALLNKYRFLSNTEWEKGTYFEKLIQCYLQNEPSYTDLYNDVWMYADWAKADGKKAQDTGTKTHTGELHAVQFRMHAEDTRMQNAGN